MRARVATTLVVGCLAAPAAFGQVRVELEIRDGAADLSVPGSAPVELANSIVQGAGSAFGSANLATGVLRASGIAPPGSFDHAHVLSGIADTLTFASGAAGTAQLDWRFEATLSPHASGPASTAALLLDVDGAVTTRLLANLDCPTSFATTCTEGTSLREIGSYEFEVGPGPLHIEAFLVLDLYAGAQAHVVSGEVFVKLPAGSSHSSASGVFLADAVPILTAVPEPETFALLLAGLALLPAGRRWAARPRP